MMRVHRTMLERVFFQSVHRCRACDSRERRPYVPMTLSRFARCPECGNEQLRTLRKRDPIDRLHRNPFSRLQSLAGGRLYYCLFCRLQYYDLRHLSPRVAVASQPARGGETVIEGPVWTLEATEDAVSADHKEVACSETYDEVRAFAAAVGRSENHVPGTDSLPPPASSQPVPL
jgi:hypothetical protein